ncbi:phage tail protein [Pectobacterium versatile]|uniref:phage tail protein n=1 Tax=Pectobacterium versatile TaxID=2488639 RepID=UPI00102F2A0E|nr:phage tail protein [Pectobacterium versatile]MBN3196017.1 tail fiber protein [Pectobacterium versatile]TAJ01381.1 phage tail protein [Pectobacterium versatile]
MANLSEQESWIDGIYQLETSDPVVAGPGGISNRQAEQLASRTAYLKKMQETTGESLQKHLAASDPHSQYAPKNSPVLTGTPTAPTTAQTANNTQIATTAFVKSALAALVNGSPAALDTLQELANALGNDPKFSTTIFNKLAQKLEKEQNGADIPDKAKFMDNIGLKSAATRAVGSGASDIPDITVGDARYLGKMATAVAATKLAAARKIAGILFDGTADIALMPENIGALPATGTAAAATKLAVVRTINGVAFDGTANISLTPANVGALPAAGTAVAATKLATARTINGVAFDGTANISLTPANVGALPAAGTAAAATKLATARTINGVAFDGSANITLTPANVGALPAAGTAAAATKLATARKINGVAFDGTADITLPLDFPAGAPIPYPLSTPPAGWIKCNGQSFDKSRYPILASRYPSGFLPDLRGEFVRGWDDGRGADAGRALMSAQGDAIRNIVGTIGQLNDRVNEQETTGVFDANKYTGSNSGLTGGRGGRIVTFDASKVVPTANENRPRNIAFNYIVRAA